MASEWWDGFANNLATDLTPLIALFGEAPTKQYLSECLTTIDIVIFAIAPLGIITSLVSAIRVCGTAPIRAFIGRAQEGRGVAEAELCTSTSREVCELYNNGGVARVFGRPKLLEIVHDKHAGGEDFYPTLKSGDPSAGIFLFKDYLERYGQEWRETTKRRDRLTWVEDGNSASSSEVPPPDLRFAPNPNLSLNVGIKQHRKGVFLAAAVVGLILQSGVLIWAAVARYRLLMVKGDLQDKYAVPMLVIGTIFLCVGVGYCALLVERSTGERIFERKLSADNRSQVYWIQPGTQFVGDQAFDSFAYTHPNNQFTKYITSWKENTEESRLKLSIAVGMAGTGFILQFLGLRACHSSVAVTQLGVTILMSIIRSMLRTDRLKREEIFLADEPDFYESHELDWLALNIGNMDQCKVGWQISMARRCQSVWRAEEKYENTPLRKMTVYDEKKCALAGFRPENSAPSIRSPGKAIYHFCFWDPEKWLSELQSNGEKGRDEITHHRPAEIAKPYLYRSRLARLTLGWEERLVYVRRMSDVLAKAIESTTKILYTSDAVFEKGWDETFTLFWPVPCTMTRMTESHSNGKTSMATSLDTRRKATDGTVYLSLKRGLDEDGVARGEWHVDKFELEAVLGLWIFSMKVTDEEQGNPETVWRRILAAKSTDSDENALTDFNLWRENESGLSIVETVSPLHEGHGRRLFGWQNLPASFDAAKSTVLELPLLLNFDHCMYVQEIYALFFASILYAIKDIGGKTTVKESRSLCLTNSNISRIQEAFTESDLGYGEDAFACIIPALRNQGKLPSPVGILPAVRATAESHVLHERWEDAARLLRWAFPHATGYSNYSNDEIGPNDPVNQQRLLTLTLCECYRKAIISPTYTMEFGWKGIVELLKEAITDGRDKISFVNMGGLSSYTLVDAIWCYAQVALRIARDNGKEDAVRELEKAIRDSFAATTIDTDNKTVDPVGLGINSPIPDDDEERPLSQAIERNDLSSALYCLSRKSALKEKDATNKTALSLAADRGWYVVVKDLLDRGAILEEKDKNDRSAISYAAESGDINTFNYLLDQGAFPNFADLERRTPLSYAAANAHVDVARKLLSDRRVEPDSKDNWDRTPLHYAAGLGRNELAELLLGNEGVDVNSQDRQGQTPLYLAADAGNEALVSTMLENPRVSVDIKDSDGNTPLFKAVIKGYDRVVERLLTRKDVDINTRNQEGMAPLAHAAEAGYDKITAQLISRDDIEVNFRVKFQQQTPLLLAAENGHADIVRRFLALGDKIDVNAKDKSGRTALSWAAVRDHEEVAKLLLADARVAVETLLNREETPLLLAALKGSEKVAALLLERRDVDFNTRDNIGVSALAWAVRAGHGRVVEMLLRKPGIDFNTRDNVGVSALAWAARHGRGRVVEMLLKMPGIDTAVCDKDGHSAVWWAREKGYEEIVGMLVAHGHE
ncbi:hypothetical protein FQN55_003474 [Onygenales sp. PD_40]|nr:hypothetical protein FQN55_003474 [Onygenales sp. PD_40]